MPSADEGTLRGSYLYSPSGAFLRRTSATYVATRARETTYRPQKVSWWLSEWLEADPMELTGPLCGALPEATAGLWAEDEGFELVLATGTSSSELLTVVSEFTERLAGLPQVRLIALEGAGREAEERIWTVISAPPFDDSFRRPVYEAQNDSLSLAQRPIVTFRLLNIEELRVQLDEALPESYHVVFERAADT